MSQYPEVLTAMRDELVTALIDNGVSDDIAQYAAYISTERIRKEWGGSQIYIPKGLKFNATERNKQIVNQFTGNNHKELARQHGLTVQRIYTILRKH